MWTKNYQLDAIVELDEETVVNGKAQSHVNKFESLFFHEAGLWIKRALYIGCSINQRTLVPRRRSWTHMKIVAEERFPVRIDQGQFNASASYKLKFSPEVFNNWRGFQTPVYRWTSKCISQWRPWIRLHIPAFATEWLLVGIQRSRESPLNCEIAPN